MRCYDNTSRTALGGKLRALRRDHLDKGGELLNWAEIDQGAGMSEVEKKAMALLAEVAAWHSDPESCDYNECDTNPCDWCEQFEALKKKYRDAD
jgi:hypothetical protein